MAAALLESAFGNGDEWLYKDADSALVRRREKAARRLIERLRKEAESK